MGKNYKIMQKKSEIVIWYLKIFFIGKKNFSAISNHSGYVSKFGNKALKNGN